LSNSNVAHWNEHPDDAAQFLASVVADTLGDSGAGTGELDVSGKSDFEFA
jgi:hypothetical protein